MKASVLLILLILIPALFILPIPKAHAGTPAIVQSIGKNSGSNIGATSENPQFTSNTAIGNIIVAVISELTAGGTTLGVSSIVDTQSLTWTAVAGSGSVQVCTAGGCPPNGEASYAGIYYSTPTTAATQDTVTVTMTHGTCCANAALLVFIYEVSGADFSQSVSNTCTSSCSTTPSIASYSYTSGHILFSTVSSGSITTACSAGFTLDFCGGTVYAVAEHLVTSSSGSTTFPYTVGAAPGAWIDVAADIGNQVVVTNVVACTFFQLQCWWYPMLFFGVYSGAFLLVGSVGKTNSRGMTYLLLTSLTFGGLLQVQMGMLNIMFPLIFTFLTVLYMVRSR